MKKLIDIFVNDEHDNPVLISAISFPETATWDDITVTKAIDERIRLCFSEKPISPAFQSMDKLDILQSMGDFLGSKEYELNGLYASTQFDYNPISNYDMTESSRDEDRATTGGSSTESSTSFDSTTQKEVGKTESSGSASNTNIHTLQRSGNIGITTTQQMIDQERGVLTFDFVQYVADLINNNFCAAYWLTDKEYCWELEAMI